MDNREKLLKRLEDVSDLMNDELEYYIQIERDYDYDRVNAFMDLWDAVEQYKKSERKLWSEIKDIVTDVGIYEEYNENMMVITSGGKPWEFIHEGQKYMISESPRVWINK